MRTALGPRLIWSRGLSWCVEVSEEGLAGFFPMRLPFLDERQNRLVAAAALQMFGRGGSARVIEARGMSLTRCPPVPVSWPSAHAGRTFYAAGEGRKQPWSDRMLNYLGY